MSDSHDNSEATPTNPPATLGPSTTELDRIDRTLLRLLQQNANLSNVNLAKKVRLSPPACLRRVDRLRSLGYIRAVVALLDPVKLEVGSIVMIGIVFDRSTPESFEAFETAAKIIPGCLECHAVSGEFDYFLMLRVRDNEHFNRLHSEVLLYLPGVRQIRSFIVLRQVYSTTALPI